MAAVKKGPAARVAVMPAFLSLQTLTHFQYLSTDPAGIAKGRYRYTDDLLRLEGATSPPGGDHPQLATPIHGFLPLSAWQPVLDSHPDQQLAAFLRRGISNGFRIGWTPGSNLALPPPNLQSARANPEAVSALIAAESRAGRLAVAEVPDRFRKNPIGAIPKSNQPGKFRLIVDLSAPRGASVNDGIDADLCSLEYASVAQAASLVKSLGRGALMAKVDLSSAYRRVPVHPDDQYLLGLEWQGVVYYDRALPFGLRSAPKIFTAVADALAWAMFARGVRNFLHYLDDFFFCAPPSSPACAQAMETVVPLCAELGLPVAPAKLDGPSTTITFLGIEIDSCSQELRLPPEKLACITVKLKQWEGRRSATKCQLQSLIGLLNHAAAVVRPGRTFLRQLIDTMKIPKRQFHRVRLNEQCKADLAWWSTFIQAWNGISLFPNLSPGPEVVSDASGSWGCGAFLSHSRKWFQIPWPPNWLKTNIATKELLPVVVAAAIWGKHWTGLCVHFYSDNQAVVAALSARATRSPQLMHLLRCLFFFEAHFGFEHRAYHIRGSHNKLADALSRDRISTFRILSPQAAEAPEVIPPPLTEMLLDLSLTWTSQRWKDLFKATLREVSPGPQRRPTPQPGTAMSPSASNTAFLPCPSPRDLPASLQPSSPTKASSISPLRST